MTGGLEEVQTGPALLESRLACQARMELPLQCPAHTHTHTHAHNYAKALAEPYDSEAGWEVEGGGVGLGRGGASRGL